MRTLFPITLIVALSVTRIALATEAPRKAPDVEFLLGFLAGDYRLIGQAPDSGATYSGRVTLRARRGAFEVIRTVARVSTQGTAAIETSGEGNAVLRMRFASAGISYEATYLWRSDLDNFPRLTGYLYRAEGRTKSPGLEALFHVPPTPKK